MFRLRKGIAAGKRLFAETGRMEDEIRSFVYETLCQDNGILENAFPSTETVLKRNGSVCGVMFCLHGPRAVKFTAVWEKDTNRILFYGANGKRYREERK